MAQIIGGVRVPGRLPMPIVGATGFRPPSRIGCPAKLQLVGLNSGRPYP